MSGIKWQKAKAIWSKNWVSFGWKADTWPKRMAPWQLAVLQYHSEANSSDAKSLKKAIEAATAAGRLTHVVRSFQMPSHTLPLNGTVPPAVFKDLPAISAYDFSQWLKNESESPSIYIQAWIDSIGPTEAITQPPAPPTLPADTAPIGTATVWTPERKEKARAARNKYRADGIKDFSARTAKDFGVTASRLNAVLSEKKSKKSVKKASFWGV